MSDISRRSTLAGLAAGATVSAIPGISAALPTGIPAPEWDIAEWINSEPLRLADLRGQVVVIDFFQLWCPGCRSFSIPLTKEWEVKYADDIAEDRMKIVSIHTVFEGHSHQTPARLRKFVEKTGFGHPVGHDRLDIHDRLPNTMILYGTRGTPEMAIIGPDGIIAFQQFGRFDVPGAERLIDALIDAGRT